MDAPSALVSLQAAVAALEAAATNEDWAAVGEQLARQRRFLERWLPSCQQLTAVERAGLNDILDRYLRLTGELDVARERARIAMQSPPPVPPMTRAARAYLEA